MGFDVARTGVASVGFVGFPSVGKVRNRTLSMLACPADLNQSTLMSKLTGTHSEISAIDFTTLTTVPGTVKVHGAPIQILDLRMSFTHPTVRSLISSQLVSSRVPPTVVVVVNKVRYFSSITFHH